MNKVRTSDRHDHTVLHLCPEAAARRQSHRMAGGAFRWEGKGPTGKMHQSDKPCPSTPTHKRTDS